MIHSNNYEILRDEHPDLGEEIELEQSLDKERNQNILRRYKRRRGSQKK